MNVERLLGKVILGIEPQSWVVLLVIWGDRVGERHSGDQGTIWMLGIKPWSAIYKASPLYYSSCLFVCLFKVDRNR